MLGSGRWTLDSGCWTLETGSWTVESGDWMLDSGHKNCPKFWREWRYFNNFVLEFSIEVNLWSFQV